MDIEEVAAKKVQFQLNTPYSLTQHNVSVMNWRVKCQGPQTPHTSQLQYAITDILVTRTPLV